MLAKGKTNSKEMKVDDMGKLQSMREIMKRKNLVDKDKSEQRINALLGSLVKRKILQKKQSGTEMNITESGRESTYKLVLNKGLFCGLV
jgi:hypothetical protein